MQIIFWLSPCNGCAQAADCVSLQPVQQSVSTSTRECPAALPESIQNESELEEVLTRPSPALIEFIKSVSSPLLVLGARNLSDLENGTDGVSPMAAWVAVTKPFLVKATHCGW
jgi:hypothetical protein